MTETLAALMARQARDRPDALALSAMRFGRPRERISYAGLQAAGWETASALAAGGLMPGARVAVLLTNDAAMDCLLVACGALFMGAVAVPCNPRWAEEELAHALALTAPSLAVSDGAGIARLQALAPDLQCLDVAARQDWPKAPPPRANDDPDALASLLFTSGTTARSKAVMHSHATMLAAGRSCAAALGIESGDRYQGAFPFFTSSALNIACAACWTAGAGFVLEHQIGNAERLGMIAEEGTSFYHGVPSILHFMAEEAAKGDYDLSALRRIAFGGAPMPPETRARMAALWPWAEQVQIYGSTESGPAGTVASAADMAAEPRSVGRAMAGYRIRIVDEAWRELPTGEAGEVVLEGPGVARGYWRNEEATAAAFQGKAVRMGDAGRLNGEGLLIFEDRAKDRINRGGLKVSSVAVEAVLLRHPAVLEAAVIAVPHKALGEDIAACLVLRDALEIEDLRAFCAGKLADYEVPRHWHVMEALPKNAMGKIQKNLLRERARSRS